jgi:hypothetical protein
MPPDRLPANHSAENPMESDSDFPHFDLDVCTTRQAPSGFCVD